jgi:hypothetical protein
VSYVLDLSTETLKSIAGIAKEAGVETNVIDVVTQGECDFLSGLTPGSYYYSSGTGFLSATIGDYEVGVSKSATNLKMNGVIPKVDEDKIAFIERLIANNLTPSIEQARLYDFWKTREVKTSSGTFTVPSNVYAVGIFCLGAGANGSTTASGGGGGLSMKIKKVNPGDTIQYTISSGIATCDGMAANPASTLTGGTASGGMFNFSGGSVAAGRSGSGGCGGNCTLGNAGGWDISAGAMGHWGQTSFWSHTGRNIHSYGGLGMMSTVEVMNMSEAGPSVSEIRGGGGFGCCGTVAYQQTDSTGAISGGIGRAPIQLGIFVTSDLTQSNALGVFSLNGYTSTSFKSGDWNGGAVTFSAGSSEYGGSGGLGGGGGSGAQGGNGGLGGGGGMAGGTNKAAGLGGLGGGGGQNQSGTGGAGGYGAGGGKGTVSGGTGGSSVVIFVF